uniref:Zinc finger PHD-type domain-containing protein n=1 Tax=Hyaloperonospora arabidopsidis (strain Emoy2) TaxID=559515 RepID=M4BKL0_HYAAE
MGDARIVLTTLMDEKLLVPGPKRLYVSYYRKRVYADLLPDGSIRYKNEVYTSPVPCALHMKRTLNPTLKTDAGWSSMYSAASGESLKDIKDRLNIRKRGTNARSTGKERKAVPPALTVKERVAQLTAALATQKAVPKCSACRKEATTDVVECSACHSKTHWKCASPALKTAGAESWFCEQCVTGQANRILEFLQQTRRVLVERITEQKKTKEETTTAVAAKAIEAKDDSSVADIGSPSTPVESAKDAVDDGEKEKEAGVEAIVSVGVSEEDETNESSHKNDTSATTAECSIEPKPEMRTNSEKKASVDSTEDALVVAEANESTEQMNVIVDAVEEKERNQAEIDVPTDVPVAQEVGNNVPESEEDDPTEEIVETGQVSVTKAEETTSAEEDFLVLIDGLIAEVSSRDDRASLIANSTGATLVHLEKTHLVQLVEYGKGKILAANLESEDDSERGGAQEEDHDDTASCNTSEVDALIKIFDLRHQILSSQSQFERTTSALAKRTEKHLRIAENEVMGLEESRTVEAMAISKMVDSIDQHSSELSMCEEKIYYDEVLLESINRRRHFIRSTNIKDRFVPSYRHSTKLMTTSSDQLLLTVLLEKLRDITEVMNEWTKMERHFVTMTSNLTKSLSLIGTKRKCTGAAVTFPPSVPLFAQIGIPPSRRLIERQIANFRMNLDSIRHNRARMRQTLSGILKIAREEHLSEEIVTRADMLYHKCRDVKTDAEEEELRLKEEAEVMAKDNEDEHTVYGRQRGDDDDDNGASVEEPETKKKCLSNAGHNSDAFSDIDSSSATTAAINTTRPREKKGISSLLGTEDSDERDSHYSSAASKSCEDSEEDLEQASRAIADISSVLPDISGGNDSRTDLLNPLLSTEKPVLDASRVFTSPGQFVIPDRNGSSDKRNTLAQSLARPQQTQPAIRFSGQSQHSFSEQGFEMSNRQQLHSEHQRQERERLRIEKQCQEQDRQEQERRELEQQQLGREHQRLQQKCREQQQRVEEQRCLEEQHRSKQQRLEQQLNKQQQQRLEQQHQEKQRQQELERNETQRQEQQRQEQQRRRQDQQRLELELRRRQQEQQQHQEQERHFQHGKSTSLPQVVPSGPPHLQVLSQQQQQQQQLQQQAALQQQQHSRQLQHPLYGDIPKTILMSAGMGTSQQDVYAQQAAQMGINMHDVVRRQDSSHFVGSTTSGSLRGAHYITPSEAVRGAVQQTAAAAARTSFYGDDGQGGQLNSQDVFGSQLMPGPQRQLPDHHHTFASELQQQQQQPDQPRTTTGQEFLMGRPYRGLNDNMQHPGLNQPDENDVNMGDWGQ